MNGTLARLLWGEDLPQLQRESKPQANMSVQEKVPERFEELLLWAYLKRVSSAVDHYRHHVLVHSTLSVPTEVTIRLQGFLRSFDVSPFGNWNR